MQNTSTNFSLETKHTLDTINITYNRGDEYLQEYQYNIKEYLIKANTRGLLIFHSPGTGKSILAASISEYYRKYDTSRKIVVLLAKSLQGNFEKNIKKYMQNNKDASYAEKSKEFIEDALQNKYKFVSLNANNMYAQISKVEKNADALAYDKYLGNLNEHISSGNKFLENSLLIIDEAHNLSGAVRNGSKNAIKLYNTIMKTRNIKLLFLTGTPIVNSPFELVPMFNMLKGYTYFNKVQYSLFPENQLEFSSYFLEIKNKDDVDIKNKEIFQNRIIGLVSYYGDFQNKDDTKKDFPLELPTIIETVHMSLPQYIRYQQTRDLEIKESSSSFSNGTKSDVFSFKDDTSNSSSYRIRSRQVSNYYIPEYAVQFNADKTSVEKFITRIKIEDLQDLPKYSPKFKKIIENIQARPNQLAVVYSEFVSGEGINLFAMTLEKVENYVYWRDAQTSDVFDLPQQKQKQTKTYAIISGNVPYNERESIIKTFNNKKNSSGEHISLLLISKSGAEGLNLRGVRSIHIMEPFWNYARIEQIIARGVRLYSHIDLPEKDHVVQPYIYVSTYPNKFNIKDIVERTTDEELLHISLNGKKIRDQFELSLIEASVDCSLNYKNLTPAVQSTITCYLCTPNNLPLYTPNIRNDIKTNNCKPFVASSIEATSIELDNVTYYYKKDPIKIYEFSTNVGGYTEMQQSNPIYSILLKKILNI